MPMQPGLCQTHPFPEFSRKDLVKMKGMKHGVSLVSVAKKSV
jgi:hypothetical protein